MFDLDKIRAQFPMLQNKMMQGKPLVFLDNASTTFRPQCVLDAMNDYYCNYTANSHRGDYDLCNRVDNEIVLARKAVADFVNSEINEVVFTSGDTEALNLIAYGYALNFLKKGDVILLSESEHASNILPWYKLAREKGIVIKFIPLDNTFHLTLSNLKKSISSKTKVISIAEITNVVGDLRNIKEITEYAHSKGVFVVVDGAQSVAHKKTNVTDTDIDFLAFSAHKMCGPTGVGVLYGKKELLEELDPLYTGGGMNESFDTIDEVYYKDLPLRLEAGTQNIAGIIGLGSAIDYLNSIGMDNIGYIEQQLSKYLIDGLSKIKHIDIINMEPDSGIVSFNVSGIFAQDVAVYLNKYNICVRAGNHCAKILKNAIGVKNTVRISLYFYNTKSEIDKLIDLLKDKDKIIKEMI